MNLAIIAGGKRRSSGAASLATDTFNRADANPIAGNWTAVAGEGNFKILTNVARPADYTADSTAYYNAVVWPANQYSKAKFVTTSTSANGTGCGLAVRIASGARTYYRLIMDSAGANNLELGKMVAGTYTLLWTRTATYVSGAILELRVTGTTLQVFYNGSQVGADFPDGAISTGNAGIAYSSLDDTSSTIDDWDGGSL